MRDSQAPANDVSWETIFNAEDGRLDLPNVEHLLVLDATSPENDEAVATLNGEVSALMPSPSAPILRSRLTLRQ